MNARTHAEAGWPTTERVSPRVGEKFHGAEYASAIERPRPWLLELSDPGLSPPGVGAGVATVGMALWFA